MSTVKAVNFQHPSSSAVNLALDSAGGVSGGLPSPNRNLLYNGAMQVAQRGTSAAGITTAGYYTADRWNLFHNSLGTWTQSVESDAPTGSGFRKSLKMLCTTADASPAADDWLFFEQVLEGQDLQRIAKGTSSAQKLTLSFWVKSNVVGTYCVTLTDADNGREVSAQYSISASSTWERKTITFPADTVGVFDNDNAGSLAVRFGLAIGANRSSGTLPATWQSAVTANLFVGQTNLAAATNNYWQVTGVQLEVGPVATSFEFKSYGQELRECQRYYYRTNGCLGRASSTTQVDIAVSHPEMRAAAAAATASGALQVTDTVTRFNQSSANVTIVDVGLWGGRYRIGNFTGLTSGGMYLMEGSQASIGISAEL